MKYLTTIFCIALFLPSCESITTADIQRAIELASQLRRQPSGK